MIRFCYIAIIMAVSGCDAMERNTNNIVHQVDEEYDNTRQRIAGLIYQAPPEPVATIPVMSARFCYQHLMDVVCYNEPQPHLYRTLIAVQGQHGYAYRDFVPQSVAQQPASVESSIQSETLVPLDSYSPQALILDNDTYY